MAGLFDNLQKTTSGATSLGATTGTQNATNTGKVTNAPYGPATGLLNTALIKAGALLKDNRLAPYVGLNAQQNAGLQTQYNLAQNSLPALGQALAQTMGYSNGAGDISSAMQSNIGARALGPSYAEQYLGNVANGSQLGANDPNFERLLEKAKADAATEAGMVASGMGRTGSDYHQTAVADTVGNLEASQRLARLQDQEARQMQAISAMESGRMGGLGAALNAYNSASGIQGANQDRRYSATQAIPGMTTALQLPGQIMQGVGDIYHADELAKANLGANNLAALQQVLAGYGNYGTQTSTGKTTGTNTGTATQYQTGSGTTQGPDNTLGNILGGGLGLASLLKGVGDAGGLSKLLGGFL